MLNARLCVHYKFSYCYFLIIVTNQCQPKCHDAPQQQMNQVNFISTHLHGHLAVLTNDSYYYQT